MNHPKKLKILYLGVDSPGTIMRPQVEALRRIGHTVVHCDTSKVSAQLTHPIFNKIHYRTGYRFLNRRVLRWVKDILENSPLFDLVWIDLGELFGPQVIELIKRKVPNCILYCIDDPTGTRDGNRFATTRKAIPEYDLCVTTRPETEQEMKNLGCSNVLRVWKSYDEIVHAPFTDPNEIPEKFRSDVVFIGTWMRHEGRDKFLLQLIDAGVPVSIWGGRWQKSPYWSRLENHWKGPAVSGRDYVAAIQGAKICLGLLSRGNRDLHATRSLEVPFAGGVFCGERTSDHQQLYVEGEEAVFWSSPEECIVRCKQLLSDDFLREKIRSAGMKKVRELQVGNEDICRKILSKIYD